MGQPVVHFEVIGKDGEKLQCFYGELFGWEIDADNPLKYGSVRREGNTDADGNGIPGGIASGLTADYPGHVTFYVGVPDVGQRSPRPRGWAAPACSDRPRSPAPASSSDSSPIPRVI
jgi:predicted enzyme related to lactoylglutathione lyase